MSEARRGSQLPAAGNPLQPPYTEGEQQRDVSYQSQPKRQVAGGDLGSSSQDQSSRPVQQQVRSMLDVDEPLRPAHTTAQTTGREPYNEGLVTRAGPTEQYDRKTTVAPTVTQETIQPIVHEIREERITRDIHTYDVHHSIQPVYEVEVLPARHYVPGPDGKLVQVSEKDLPGCTGANQRWHVEKNEPDTNSPLSKPLPDPPTSGRTVERRADGFERTEETIVHPPRWAEATSHRIE